MTAGGFIQKYATGNMGLERGPVLWAVTGSAATWLVFTLLAGIISDKIGRRNTYILGFIAQIVGIAALFPLVNTGDITKLFLALALLTVGLGFTYGQQSAFYTESVSRFDAVFRGVRVVMPLARFWVVRLAQ